MTLLDQTRGLLAYLRTNAPDVTANNLDTAVIPVVERLERVLDAPEITLQQLIDARFNAFGLQLFAESVADHNDAQTFKPFSFRFRGVLITLQPAEGERIDTRHH